MIVVNAHRINMGDYPECNSKDTDFFFIDRSGEQEMLEAIRELVVSRLPSHYEGIDPVRDIQVLTPVRKGTVGVMNLNRELQKVLNPPSGGSGQSKREKQFGQQLFREGDKVMQIRNNYEKSWVEAGEFTEGEGVFNGDLGMIDSIDKENERLTVVFDDNKYAWYDFSELDQLETAYAVTVHKSQGSEFPIIVMPMSWFPPMLATRNLLYTAITRGKQLVVLVGSRNKMKAMVDNNQIRRRYSGLRARLVKYMG
jgi:exodeoxyribonuclease V alpha subunit